MDMDGFNDFRTSRVAEVLADFHTLQNMIVAMPVDPLNADDYHTEGWAVIRRCYTDGQHILNRGADTSVVQGAMPGEEERVKAELIAVLLDAYSRRHEAQKIFLRQVAAQKWVDTREQVLQGRRPSSREQGALNRNDQELRRDLSVITDESVYIDLDVADFTQGRWTMEDPPLRAVQRWLRTQR